MVVLPERNPGGINGREQGRGRHRRSPLNVVVESAQPIAIAPQQPRRIGAGKIFPLQKDVRPAAFDSAHKGLDKIVVLLPADALVPPADIDGIIEQHFVVSAHVEQDGQTMFGRNATQRRVERHLADGNAHAARALIAQAKDAFSIAHHNAPHVIVAGVAKNLCDAVPVRVAQKKTARLAPDFGKALAPLAHRRRVNDRQQLLGVLGDQRIEQRLIAVLQVAHIGVFVECGGMAVERALASLALIFQRPDVRRQQAVQRESIALRLRECRPLVEARIHEQTESVKAGANNAAVSAARAKGLQRSRHSPSLTA